MDTILSAFFIKGKNYLYNYLFQAFLEITCAKRWFSVEPYELYVYFEEGISMLTSLEYRPCLIYYYYFFFFVILHWKKKEESIPNSRLRLEQLW
jgi:hypothetical protein